MGFEDQARFLTAKYGTAAGPTGLPHPASFSFDLAALMIILGLLLFAAIVFVLVRDWQSHQAQHTEPLQ